MSTRSNLKLLDEVRQRIRIKHYSIHTERSYCDWIRQFVKFHRLADKSELLVNSEGKMEAFLSYLAMERNVAASTQNQAMSALIHPLKTGILERERYNNVHLSRDLMLPIYPGWKFNLQSCLAACN
ncbi:MAG: phage integrase N-terminal SAM-like domain-containing protein [Methylococcales bacterium]